MIAIDGFVFGMIRLVRQEAGRISVVFGIDEEHANGPELLPSLIAMAGCWTDS